MGSARNDKGRMRGRLYRSQEIMRFLCSEKAHSGPRRTASCQQPWAEIMFHP
jgi:hypothetical protein